MAKLKKLFRTKKGGEAAEESFITIADLLKSALIIMVIVGLWYGINNIFLSQDIQSSEESFYGLVTKMQRLELEQTNDEVHAYFIKSGLYMFGFNDDPDTVDTVYSRGEEDVTTKPTTKCNSQQACLCLCNAATCDKEYVTCNIGIGNKKVKFTKIKKFVVVSDSSSINQGNERLFDGVNGEYLAIYGRWGGWGMFGRHLWPQGRVLYLKKEKEGEVVKISTDKKI